MSDLIKTRIADQLDELPEHLQVQVLEFVQALRAVSRQGVPGRRLLQFAGSIPADELDRMRRAIDDDCERIDQDAAVDRLDLAVW